MLSRTEFLDFVSDFWREAVDPTPTEIQRNIAKVLERIASDTAIRDSDEPPSRLLCGSDPMAVFSQACRALWFNRPALDCWVKERSIAVPRVAPKKPSSVPLWFYDGKPFGNAIIAYVEAHRQHALWDDSKRTAAWPRIPRGSIIVHGVDDRVVWIGVRTADELRAALEEHAHHFRRGIEHFTNVGTLLGELNQNQRALLLQEPVMQIQDVLLSGTKIVHPAARKLARELGYALGQSNLTIVNGGLRSDDGREETLDYLTIGAMEGRLLERGIAPKERILTIHPSSNLRDPKQAYFAAGVTITGTGTNTEERRAMMLNHCRMILTLDGGEGSRVLAAFAVRRKKRRIPVLPIVATPGGSAAAKYWEQHEQQLVRKDFGLDEAEVNALHVANPRRDDREFARLIVSILERTAGKTRTSP